ncbi:MAG: transglutaminase domain-containing protein [Clostridiales bacterium]|nr:transglutaminase domain-containing protein [Clostridiales bacterium]
MKKIFFLISILIIFIVVLIPVKASAADYTINTDNISNGVIDVAYNSTLNTVYYLKIVKGDQSIWYTLIKGTTDQFSLTFGNGTYTLKILETTEAGKARTVKSIEVNVYIENSTDIYLNSVQNVEWNNNMDSIDYSNSIIYETVESLIQKVKVYELIIFNYSYDYNKFDNVKASFYLPVIDDTFHSQMGICYDYSSLLAGMLRSQGVPTKLVKGYASFSPDVYHAWNEIYINGKWYVIDTTYDAYYVKRGTKVTMFKNPNNYNKVYEY